MYLYEFPAIPAVDFNFSKFGSKTFIMVGNARVLSKKQCPNFGWPQVSSQV